MTREDLERDRFLVWYEPARFQPGESLEDFCFRVWKAALATARSVDAIAMNDEALRCVKADGREKGEAA